MMIPPPVIHMTPDQLYNWRQAMHLSKREAAMKLGLARNTLRAYERGKYPIPRYIMLACDKLASDAEFAGAGKAAA